jgi:hypothetical protein
MKRKRNQGLVYFGNQGYSNFFEGMNSDGDGGITKKALVAVEGTFDDSQGNSHTFSPERLNTIADHTNAALEMGSIIPVCQDHNKTVDSTVGTVDGMAYVKPIEQSDLPNAKSTHLLGKLGLFLEDVHIKTANAVNKVRDGVVTSVSMGLNLDPKEHRIMELSLVPIPAIPNMGLFRHKSASFGMQEDIDSQAFTWEDLEQDSLAMDELQDEFDDLTKQLWLILKNIYTSDAVNITDVNVLKQYVYSAMNGYSIRVMDLLGLNDEPEPTDPMADASAMNASQAQQMQQTQLQDVNQASMPMGASYGKGQSGLINFKKAAIYLK